MRRMTVEDLRLIFGGVWLVIFVSVFLANVVGNHLGRRRRGSGLDAAQLGVQGRLLGLLGLLLAFSFATAAGRFADRQELTLQESNAIGTAYLRADLLPPPHADALRAALKSYVAARIAFYDAGSNPDAVRATIATGEELHKVFGSAGVAGVRENPAATTVVVAALNEVIDLHAARVDALHRHLPSAVVLLLLTAMLGAAVSASARAWLACGTCGATSRLSW